MAPRNILPEVPSECGPPSNSDSCLGSSPYRFGTSARGLPWEIFLGDATTVMRSLPSNEFACAVTSPPYYWQRDYNVRGQIGMEPDIQSYVESIVKSMSELSRILRDDGVLFLNLGDTYYSAKGEPKGTDRKNRARRFGLRAVDRPGLGVSRKTSIGLPWRIAIRMIDEGWILRSPIVWHRPNSIPEPTAHDRPWRTHEMLFLFSKRPRYYFNRSMLHGTEDVWVIPERRRPNNGSHAAAFPDALVERCLAVGCREGGKVIDPFAGSGTVPRVALSSGRPATGIDLSPTYCAYMAQQLLEM